ncbi:MAG: hypothetical protein ACOY5W_01720 [Pseudomonadota bacterium]|jgi:hypothetical protein
MKRLALLGVLLLAGCVREPISLVSDGAVSVETVSSDVARVWWADVLAGSRGIQVTGEVIRRRDWAGDHSGHVEIEVRAPDGRRILMTEAVLEPVPTPGGDSRRFSFSVTLADRLPPASTVRVIHHVHDDIHGT